jgi:hypothetical protein
VRLKRREVVEGVRATALAGVDGAHEDVPHVGPTLALEEEGVLPMEDGLLERPLADGSCCPEVTELIFDNMGKGQVISTRSK